MSCKVTVRQAGPVSIMDLAGRITAGDGAIQVRDAIQKAAKGGAKNIVVNLEGVAYLDSSGLGELVSAYTVLRNAGGQLKLMRVRSGVQQLLKITNLNAVFTCYEDEASALQSFAPEAAEA